MEKKLNVLITTNIPSPYFVDYANELTKYVDLTIIFELNNAKDRNSNWQYQNSKFKFNYYFLNGIRFGNESCLSFKIKHFLKNNKYDRIIIANPTTPTGIIALMYLRKHKIPFIIQSEGGFRGSGKGLKERFKKYLMEKASFYLTGMGNEDDYFLSYGATKVRLKKYKFTSLYKNDIDVKILNDSEKMKLRKSLGLSYKHFILYVGQFIDRKNIPDLLTAYKEVQNKDTCLVLIGGEPSKKYKKLEKKYCLKNVYYYSFKNKEEMKKYYRAADVFVLPTKEDTWGLVINEAMAHGLPVVSSDRSIAAKYLIKNNVNGFIYPFNNENLLTRYIKIVLYDKNLSSKMATNCIKQIKDYSIENMTKTISTYLV